MVSAGIKDAEILVMSYIPARYVKYAASADVTITVYDETLVKAYDAELSAAGVKKPVKCHVKVNIHWYCADFVTAKCLAAS